MYRLTLYYLIALISILCITGFLGVTQYNTFDIIYATALVTLTCYFANWLFAKIFGAITNIESVFITALIIILIFPIKFPHQAIALVGVSLLAMGSKYLLTVDKRHLFNPAAVAVLMISLLSSDNSATWWVGTPILVLPVLLGGILLVRKVQRGQMVTVFILTYILITGITGIIHGNSIFSLWQRGFLSSAILFYAFVMLTEPLTSPSTKKNRSIYSVLIAFLYTTPLLRLGSFVLTPEMALIAGNIYSYIVNPKYRLDLALTRKIRVSPDTYVFEFDKPKDFKFTPGQYLEWTLPHNGADSRGNRRYFSIASSPQESIMMAVKFYSPSSTYKRALLALNPGQHIIASSLAGDFVMPKKRQTPLAFIAGGVGIAPFRSIIEDVVRNKEKVDIVVIFTNRKREDILFLDTLDKAREFGVRSLYVLTDKDALPQNWGGLIGHVTPDVIAKNIPDFKNRKFFISGPQLMVQNFEKILRDSGVSGYDIKVDFFPGYSETAT